MARPCNEVAACPICKQQTQLQADFTRMRECLRKHQMPCVAMWADLQTGSPACRCWPAHFPPPGWACCRRAAVRPSYESLWALKHDWAHATLLCWSLSCRRLWTWPPLGHKLPQPGGAASWTGRQYGAHRWQSWCLPGRCLWCMAGCQHLWRMMRPCTVTRAGEPSESSDARAMLWHSSQRLHWHRSAVWRSAAPAGVSTAAQGSQAPLQHWQGQLEGPEGEGGGRRGLKTTADSPVLCFVLWRLVLT